MQALVDGLLINYSRTGKGRTVLLLHGWGNTSAALSSIYLDLSKKYDVISPDLPGFGGSSEPKSDWDLTDYANLIEAFLAKIGAKNIYAIIGHSNGGAVAIKILSRSKVRATKLVLIASSGIRNSDRSKKKYKAIKAKLGKALLSPLPKNTKDKIRSKYYENIGSDYLLFPNLAGTFKKIVAEDISSDAATIKVPTLLIYGQEDTSTPVEHGMMLHQLINGSTLEIIPNAGHFVFKEQGQKVLKLIQDFINAKTPY